MLKEATTKLAENEMEMNGQFGREDNDDMPDGEAFAGSWIMVCAQYMRIL